MDQRVLILASGKATRFGGVKKQLLRLPSGTTIIERTMCQCRKRGASPVLVTCDGEIAATNGGYAFVPEKHERTVDTFYSTKPLWSDKTIVLLGDVVYSNTLMDRIFSTKDMVVFGHEFEIFSVVFMRDHHSMVSRALCNTEYPGKLRTFHQALTGSEQGGSGFKNLYWHRVCYINDYTADVDTQEDWVDMQKKPIEKC